MDEALRRARPHLGNDEAAERQGNRGRDREKSRIEKEATIEPQDFERPLRSVMAKNKTEKKASATILAE